MTTAPSDFKIGQKIQIAGPRGTRQEALYVDTLPSGRVIVIVDGETEFIDREDIES